MSLPLHTRTDGETSSSRFVDDRAGKAYAKASWLVPPDATSLDRFSMSLGDGAGRTGMAVEAQVSDNKKDRV